MILRFFIEISYRGTAYHGWQVQKNAVSVQEILNNALQLITGEDIETTGSGRTDTGVHALQQYVHVDLEKKINENWLTHKLNNMLPKDIAIKCIREVNPEAHARFSVQSRSYEYLITRVKDPFLINRAFYLRRALDISLMQEGAEYLKNTTDFESFSKVKTQVNHFQCKVSDISWDLRGSLLIFSVTADRFLRGMVRTLVGTLLDLGSGKIDFQAFKEIVLSHDRKQAGRAVPAHGLYLKKIVYPKDIFKS